MKFKDIVSIAEDVVENVQKKKELPSKAGGCTKGEYAYILTKSVLNPGKEIAKLNYSYAPNPNGGIIDKKLTKKEYQGIASDVNKFVSPNKRLPNYDGFQNKKISIDLCIYCFAKIIIFYNQNKRMPNTCSFDSNVFKKSTNAKYTTKGGKICQRLANLAKMNINNYKDIYTAIGKIFSYSYYYNDLYVLEEIFSRRKGNCTDLNQVQRTALLEIYDKDIIQIVRGLVRCNDGKTYGHVWDRIKVNGSWINIDASAAAKGKPLGSVICKQVVQITNINPSWAVTDDGRT